MFYGSFPYDRQPKLFCRWIIDNPLKLTRKPTLSLGLIPQLEERCTGIAEVLDSNPVQTRIFFRRSFRCCLSCVHHCKNQSRPWRPVLLALDSIFTRCRNEFPLMASGRRGKGERLSTIKFLSKIHLYDPLYILLSSILSNQTWIIGVLCGHSLNPELPDYKSSALTVGVSEINGSLALINISDDNVLGWKTVLKILPLPSKRTVVFFGRSFSLGHSHPIYQPPEEVCLLNEGLPRGAKTSILAQFLNGCIGKNVHIGTS